MNKHRIETEKLMQLLMKDRSFQSFMASNAGEMNGPPFHEHISELQQKKGESAGAIIRRGMIEKSYGHQLFSGRRSPSRDTCLQLAFGLELDVEQTQRLLRVAGKSTLYPRILRDAAIIYSIHNHVSIADTQIALEKLGVPVIGEERTRD